MILVSDCQDWRQVGVADLRTVPFSITNGCSSLHASIYRERADVGAVVVSSPKGVGVLAGFGGRLPLLFDEQARHLGVATKPLSDGGAVPIEIIRETLGQGANAVLLGERLLCLGMNCERVVCNTELYEKCVQAYVIATAGGSRISTIPSWVRFIANRRLLRDERRAAASYRRGVPAELTSAY